MELTRKLEILADAAKYDASCASSGSKRGASPGGIGNTSSGICHSYTPDGRCVSLLKILLTNHCIFDCAYCINRVSSDVQRAKFAPQDVVRLTMEFYKRNYIEGLFLSSGIFISPDNTMEEMIEVTRSLREDHQFNGYIHLKAVAGCSAALLERAGRFADRLSANIELPTQADLNALAPAKSVSEITTSMQQMSDKIDEAKAETRTSANAPKYAPAGQSTQMIIGATPSTDAQILNTASSLYKNYGLRRVYYSAFSPIPSTDARLPAQAPPLVREHRLYEADWMLRLYGYHISELFGGSDESLRYDVNPKLAWALANQHFFPVDVNRASKQKLLRVPGIGLKSVERILQARRFQKLRLNHLAKIGVLLRQARFFITTEDANPFVRELGTKQMEVAFAPPQTQLTLFGTVAAT